MSDTIVGMDLGTTFSLVAVMQDERPVVLPNVLGETLTASAVSLADDGKLLVGAAARARALTAPGRTALSFKRAMGTSRKFDLGGRAFTATELSALVLRQLREDAEAALGRPVDEAIVTVPAYFGDLQRAATRDAAEIAGLKVERIINEPTAAALAYGLQAKERELRAIVLDLGGGTFDVTVLEILEGVIEVQASAGDASLGGDDFDACLSELLVNRLRNERGLQLDLEAASTNVARLREAAEQAKKRLSADDRTLVALPGVKLVGGRTADVELELTRAEAEAAWGGLLERVRAPILRALRDVGLSPARVDEVLLVGGSTRMPVIAQLAANLFGRLPLRNLPPDEAVALGAAVQAGLKARHAAVEDMVVTDIAPFSLGTDTGVRRGDLIVDGFFTPILERGTVIPASRVRTFHTMVDRQTELNIAVYQGEHALCRDNVKLGEYMVRGIPPAPRGEQSLDVRFTYDLNGILDVDIVVNKTGQRHTLTIQRSPGRLSPEQVSAARVAMAKLKTHPRESLPNATALARADALYVELVGEPRAVLAETIQAFTVALDAQEPRAIESAREALIAVTAAYRSDRA